MTNEEKRLLIKDLCARLPYGVIVRYRSVESEGDIKLGYGNIGYVSELGRGWWKECKPYLRPMSSLTEEERDEYDRLVMCNASWVVDDWLNAHQFDYRGLIPMCLALEAPEGMYKSE